MRALWSWDPDVDLAWALSRRAAVGGAEDGSTSTATGWRHWIARRRRTDSDRMTGEEA